MTLYLALAFVMIALAVWIFKRVAGTSPRTFRLPAAPKQRMRMEPRHTEEYAEEITHQAPVYILGAENPVAPSLGQRMDEIERTLTECETDILGQCKLQIETACEVLESIRIQLLYMQLLEETGNGLHPIGDS